MSERSRSRFFCTSPGAQCQVSVPADAGRDQNSSKFVTAQTGARLTRLHRMREHLPSRASRLPLAPVSIHAVSSPVGASAWLSPRVTAELWVPGELHLLLGWLSDPAAMGMAGVGERTGLRGEGPVREPRHKTRDRVTAMWRVKFKTLIGLKINSPSWGHCLCPSQRSARDPEQPTWPSQ